MKNDQRTWCDYCHTETLVDLVVIKTEEFNRETLHLDTDGKESIVTDSYVVETSRHLCAYCQELIEARKRYWKKINNTPTTAVIASNDLSDWLEALGIQKKEG